MKNKNAPSSLVRQRMRTMLTTATTINLDGYTFLTRKDNPQLFRYLDRYGFFKFHRSNYKKLIVGYHQVALYLHRGWKLHYYGHRYCVKGQLEIHHLDHNPQNNEVSNLWYVTPTENKALATLTNVAFNKVVGYYKGQAKFNLDIINMYRDVSLNFPALLIKTLLATSDSLNKIHKVQQFNLLQTFLDNCPFKQAKLLCKTIFA